MLSHLRTTSRQEFLKGLESISTIHLSNPVLKGLILLDLLESPFSFFSFLPFSYIHTAVPVPFVIIMHLN
jgi:hypothetical protein